MNEPLVIVVAPVHTQGAAWECSAYVCWRAGWRCDRLPGEEMAVFVERAEREAEDYAQASGSLLILLHPDATETG